MTYEHLPPDWLDPPVTDADLFEDVVDLLITQAARRRGCIGVFVCEPDGRLLQPLCIEPVPLRRRPREVAYRLGRLFAHLADAGVGHIVLAVGRPGPPLPDRHDLDLRVRLLAAADAAGLEVLGVGLATPSAATALADAPLRRIA